MLSRLVYKSKRVLPFGEMQIDEILTLAHRNNSELDITGILLYDKLNFVQYLEGPAEHLNFLFEKLKVDARHTQVRSIMFGPAKRRLFPSWVMAARQISEISAKFQTEVSAEERTVFDYLLTEDYLPEDRALLYIKHFVSR